MNAHCYSDVGLKSQHVTLGHQIGQCDSSARAKGSQSPGCRPQANQTVDSFPFPPTPTARAHIFHHLYYTQEGNNTWLSLFMLISTIDAYCLDELIHWQLHFGDNLILLTLF